MQDNTAALAGMPEDQSAFEAWMNRGMVAEATEEVETPGATDSETEQHAGTAADSGTDEEKAQEQSGEEKKAEGEEKSGDEEKKPKKGGFQRRIDQLTAEKRELEERLTRLETGKAGSDAARPETKQADGGKPKAENFATFDEYTEALTDWKVTQALETREAATRQKAAADRTSQLQTQWAEREEALLADPEYADYAEKLDEAADLHVPAHVRDMLLESDHGPKLAYWLASHPAEARAILSLDAAKAGMALGRVEALITTKPEPAKKPARPVSQAPAPIKPVGGTGSRSFNPMSEDMEFEAWERKMNERERKGW